MQTYLSGIGSVVGSLIVTHIGSLDGSPIAPTRKRHFYGKFCRVITTNGWRHSTLARNDQLSWCPSCTTHVYEDALHCIWSRSTKALVWTWLTTFIQNAIQLQHCNIVITPVHALLGASLSFHQNTLAKLWKILIRGIHCS